jgi:hypothetical protein
MRHSSASAKPVHECRLSASEPAATAGFRLAADRGASRSSAPLPLHVADESEATMREGKGVGIIRIDEVPPNSVRNAIDGDRAAV